MDVAKVAKRFESFSKSFLHAKRFKFAQNTISQMTKKNPRQGQKESLINHKIHK